MSPELACPNCGKPTQFHEDEIAAVELGSALCVDCQLHFTEVVVTTEPFIKVALDQMLGSQAEKEDE